MKIVVCRARHGRSRSSGMRGDLAGVRFAGTDWCGTLRAGTEGPSGRRPPSALSLLRDQENAMPALSMGSLVRRLPVAA